MLCSIFNGQAEDVLRRSADQMEGYIASEETINRFYELFIRLTKQSRPSINKGGGYKAFVLAQQN